jgi:hypothetical protein
MVSMILFFYTRLAFSVRIFYSEAKLLGLSGGATEADVYRIDQISASTDFETAVPLWQDLKTAASAENVNLLTIPQNPPMFCDKSSLIVPLLVLTTILEAMTLCPASLIPLLSPKFQEFDWSSTQAKACTSLHLVLEFLWVVSKKLVPPSIVAIDSSTDGLDWSSRLHFTYIQPPPCVPMPLHFWFPLHLQSPVDLTSKLPMNLIAGDKRVIRDATEYQFMWSKIWF